MSTPLGYIQPRPRSTYTAPRGTDPAVYMHELALEADALCREHDYPGALRLLHKRLAVISYYRGSRTVHAAQAMASLASATRLAGREQDAQVWAYYALRAYAALLMDNEAPHKQHIADGIALLDQAYPGLLEAPGCAAVPDFTTGKLRYPSTPVDELPLPLSPVRTRLLP